MESVEQPAVIEELETRLAAQKAQLSDLATMGAVITSILDIEAVLSVTMDMAIRLVDGEVGLIMLQEEGELKPQVTWGVGGAFVKSLVYEDGRDLADCCFRERKTIILADLDLHSPEGIVLDSVIASPIQTKERCLGVMIVINKSSRSNYTSEDRDILEMLLNFVAVAVENAILVRGKLKQQKIAQEMAIAKQVQETILPSDIDTIAGAQIGVAYSPARDVGGDFYDVIRLGDQRFIVIIGDVSNKGVPAALVMSACSGIIKSILTWQPEITVAALAETLNDLMADQIIKDREMFVTLFFCLFDLENGRLTYCNAGHLPGLFWNSRGQSIEPLADGGPILGQFVRISYGQGTRDLASGDRLFLFTDGLTEAVDSKGNLFGRERAEQVFSAEIGADPKEFCLNVKQWVDRFTQGAAEDTHDDFTIVQVKVD